MPSDSNLFVDYMPIDYASFSNAKDKVDPLSPTYLNTEDVGMFSEHMREGLDPKKDLVDLDKLEGTLFEGDNSIPLLLLITKLQTAEYQVCPQSPSNDKLQFTIYFSSREKL